MPSLPRRSAPFVFAFLLSGFMTFVVSGIATLVAIGLAPEFLALWARAWITASLWARAWITAWLIAFPALLLVRPLGHRRVERLTG